MAYSYDPIFAADPANPEIVAQSASITIFDPADATKTPIAITDVTGSPLPNPITVNAQGFGPAFQATLDRVGWFGAGFQGFLTSYEGMRAEAQAAKTAAQGAANDAAGSAAQIVTAAAVNGSGRLILTKANGQTADAGPVVGPPGAPGAPGLQGPQGPAGISNIALDTDGVPYFAAGSNAVQILADTDGTPYYV